MLKYKNFGGDISYGDGRLIIKLLHIDDTITDECDSASEAQGVFESLVDEYLLTCELIGKEPCKPFKGSFNVRLTPDLHRQSAMAALENGESLNTWVKGAIESELADTYDYLNKLALSVVGLTPRTQQQYSTSKKLELPVQKHSFSTAHTGSHGEQSENLWLDKVKAVGNG